MLKLEDNKIVSVQMEPPSFEAQMAQLREKYAIIEQKKNLKKLLKDMQEFCLTAAKNGMLQDTTTTAALQAYMTVCEAVMAKGWRIE